MGKPNFKWNLLADSYLHFEKRKNSAPQFSSRDHRRDKLFPSLQQKDGGSV
jgi:hypothetical protein